MPATEEDLRKALKAFKKRLKLTKLDDDSRIGHGPLSGTGKIRTVSIQPPAGFGKEIWKISFEILVHVVKTGSRFRVSGRLALLHCSVFTPPVVQTAISGRHERYHTPQRARTIGHID